MAANPHFAWKLTVLLVLIVCPAWARAVEADNPSYVVRGMTVGVDGEATARHDGSMTVVDWPAVAAHDAWPATHAKRVWFDRATGHSYMVDSSVSQPNCEVSTFSGGPILGDPFDGGAQKYDPKRLKAKLVGSATINGMATQQYKADGASFWIDPSTGLPIKVVASMGGADQTWLEVKQFSLTKPAAADMALPGACKTLSSLQAAKPAAASASSPADAKSGAVDEGQLRDEMRIRNLTGNANAAAYRLADRDSAASKESCSVQFSVVEAKTLKPVTQGVTVSFGSGNSRESMTERIKDGVLQLADVPERFGLGVSVTNEHGSQSTAYGFYRQCFGKPKARLLYVVDASHLADSGDFLWVAPADGFKPLPPAPKLAPAEAVHRVIAGDEDLSQRPQAPGEPVRWRRLSSHSYSTADETSRDADSVHLTDLVSHEKLTLNVKSGLLIIESGNFMGASKRITLSSAQINGFNVASINTADGEIRLTVPGHWQATGGIHGDWQEVRRDGWSVYLHEASSGDTLQLDLYKHLVLASKANESTPTNTVAITNARVSAAPTSISNATTQRF